MRILHQHASGIDFHAPDPPRGIAQQHDVARVALDGEVFVERADHDAFRFGHHREERGVGNRAAAGDGGQPRSAARAQFAVHAIAMQVGAVASAPGRNAFGKHFERFVHSSRAVRSR